MSVVESTGAALIGPLATAGEHLVVVVAHPDDETFGCGSLIAQSAAAGARVTVVCATRGEAGERVPDPITDSWPLGLVREVELCQAARVLGVDEVEILDHLDSGFDGEAHPRALVNRDLSRLADELALLFLELGPDVVLTLDGSDGHRDHVHLRDAVGRASASSLRAPRVVHVGLPRSLMRRWAEEKADAETAHLALDPDALGRPDEELSAIGVEAFVDQREQAIACHRSQASPFDGLSPALRRAFLETDHVVEIVARRR